MFGTSVPRLYRAGRQPSLKASVESTLAHHHLEGVSANDSFGDEEFADVSDREGGLESMH